MNTQRAFMGAVGLALAICGTAATAAPPPIISGEDGGISLGRQVRLANGNGLGNLLLAAEPGAAGGETQLAAFWSAAGRAKGRVFPDAAGAGEALDLGLGAPVGLGFADDELLHVGLRREQGGADAVLVSRFEGADEVDQHDLGPVPNTRAVALDFFADGEIALGIAGGPDFVVRIVSPEGVEIAATELSPIAAAGVDRSPRVSVHGDEVLVGWDRAAGCGGNKEKQVAVVARLDRDAELVRHPRRFSSGACGRSGKALRFLGGPSDVGSLAVFADASARRFITGLPAPSELDFAVEVTPGEAILAVAMDDAQGRLLAITRTTGANKPVRLFAQGFGRDGKARTPKLVLDDATSLAGATPQATAVMLPDGSAWVAFTRVGGPGADGLFLREVQVAIP
jgi:hypothetical protein